MNDLVIRDATLVDGSGAPARVADVAVKNGLIAEVGAAVGAGRREIRAEGLLLTPGFVDIHTHYDGQATWDASLTPSCWHGVTTAVFGNCGVGFAPLKPGHSEYLINLMQGVEDIPEAVLAEGIDFSWESFPEYMAALERMPHAIDIGTQLPHGALRFYVMGDRGSDHRERPTDAELERMTQLVEESLAAGALGVTTSRTPKHRAADGRPTPSMTADAPELAAIAEGLRRAGRGVLQVNSDFGPGEFELLRQAAAHAGRPLSVLLLQSDKTPDLWRETLANLRAGRAAGLAMNGQVGAKGIGILMAFDASRHPFLDHPAWEQLAGLAGREVAARLRQQPALRERLVGERTGTPAERFMQRMLERSFVMDDTQDYEPDMRDSLGARAQREGTTVWALAMAALLECDGEGLLMHPFENYSGGSLDVVREMLVSEATVMGLSDAGAHVGVICDGAGPTFLLKHWARDRRRGERIPLEFLVAKQTRGNALAYGMPDRGLVAPGLRADLNLIDFGALDLLRPRIVRDLPAGGKRFIQRARGYRHTFVAGVEILRDDELTGELPGRLVRSAAFAAQPL
jgi:N-acyl-D-aspartate/D-glutamate deacylase